jgi:hypothetical protein
MMSALTSESIGANGRMENVLSVQSCPIMSGHIQSCSIGFSLTRAVVHEKIGSLGCPKSSCQKAFTMPVVLAVLPCPAGRHHWNEDPVCGCRIGIECPVLHAEQDQMHPSDFSDVVNP